MSKIAGCAVWCNRCGSFRGHIVGEQYRIIINSRVTEHVCERPMSAGEYCCHDCFVVEPPQVHGESCDEIGCFYCLALTDGMPLGWGNPTIWFQQKAQDADPQERASKFWGLNDEHNPDGGFC